VEDRQRSVAQFEGELFYEPDEIPDDMDPAAVAELRQDRAVCLLYESMWRLCCVINYMAKRLGSKLTVDEMCKQIVPCRCAVSCQQGTFSCAPCNYRKQWTGIASSR
jgi:hypothetical protein